MRIVKKNIINIRNFRFTGYSLLEIGTKTGMHSTNCFYKIGNIFSSLINRYFPSPPIKDVKECIPNPSQIMKQIAYLRMTWRDKCYIKGDRWWM